MSILVDLSIFPIGKGESVSPYVARALKVVRQSGLPHKLGPMGTTIEGEWDEVMATVRACFDALREDCSRVYLNLKMDYRKMPSGRIDAKMASVSSKLD